MIREALRYVKGLGEVARTLHPFEDRARAISSPDLRHQALSALSSKRFHAWGAAAAVLGVPKATQGACLQAVLAIQTISDYLDNLVDRSRTRTVGEARRLHRAMVDALTPGAPVHNYYGEGDGETGYLDDLVAVSQRALLQLPGYPRRAAEARRLARRYGQLQVLKHIFPTILREGALIRWQRRMRRSPLLWWERAAAAGSTLPLFGLLAEAAGDPSAGLWREAWGDRVAALHILLDYAIDREEDRRGGDFNLTLPGGSLPALSRRMAQIARWAAHQGGAMAPHQRLLLLGLPALYLTDPKALRPSYAPLQASFWRAFGKDGLVLFVLAFLTRTARFSALDRLAQKGQ